MLKPTLSRCFSLNALLLWQQFLHLKPILPLRRFSWNSTSLCILYIHFPILLLLQLLHNLKYVKICDNWYIHIYIHTIIIQLFAFPLLAVHGLFKAREHDGCLYGEYHLPGAFAVQYLLHVPRMPHEQTKISMHEDFVSKAFYKLIVSVATAIHRHPRPCIRLDTRPSRSVQMRRFGRGDYVWKAPRSLEIA